MSLDYNTAKIADRKVHFPPDEQGKMNDTLHALIWNMLAIDMTEITEDNIDEVWYRTDMWQRLIGAQFQQWEWRDEAIRLDGREMKEGNGEWKPLLFTRDDIVHAVGLHTNVGLSTRHQFIKKVTGRFQA